MKEYCLTSVVKPKCIAKLTITRYQYDEMTDKQIEKVISDYLKMNKIKGDVKVINKDIFTQVEDKAFVIIGSTDTYDYNWNYFTISIIDEHPTYDVVDSSKIITFN